MKEELKSIKSQLETVIRQIDQLDSEVWAELESEERFTEETILKERGDNTSLLLYLCNRALKVIDTLLEGR